MSNMEHVDKFRVLNKNTYKYVTVIHIIQAYNYRYDLLIILTVFNFSKSS